MQLRLVKSSDYLGMYVMHSSSSGATFFAPQACNAKKFASFMVRFPALSVTASFSLKRNSLAYCRILIERWNRKGLCSKMANSKFPLFQENFVLQARSKIHHWEGTGPLSIKTFRNGRAYYKTKLGHYAVESDSYLLLNEGVRDCNWIRNRSRIILRIF